MERIPPMEMAKKIARQLRRQRPDYRYLSKVFQYTRQLLEVVPNKKEKRLPQLLTDEELAAFYQAVFSARNPTHVVMIKLLIFTGVRNRELAQFVWKMLTLTVCKFALNKVREVKTDMFRFPPVFAAN